MDTIPQEVVQKILLFCDFGAWCCARFVCRMWAKICAECDWKTDEFTQYKCECIRFGEIYVNPKYPNYYNSYLPNGIKHGMSYDYLHNSENIFAMSLWVHGKELLSVGYNRVTHLSEVLDYFTTDDMKISFGFHMGTPATIISGKKYRIIKL